jgi:predicted RNase H-like HicB family nuclease
MHIEQRTETGRIEEGEMNLMQYLVVVEKGPSSYGAYVPDLPDCAAAGETKDEVLSLIREAIELHLEDLKKEGQPIPAPSSVSEVVEVETV